MLWVIWASRLMLELIFDAPRTLVVRLSTKYMYAQKALARQKRVL